MTTLEKTISKQQRPSLRIPFGHRHRTELLLLKNGQMVSKHPQAFPMLGELPSLAGNKWKKKFFRIPSDTRLVNGISQEMAHGICILDN